MSQQRIKKTIIILLALAVLWAATGCSLLSDISNRYKTPKGPDSQGNKSPETNEKAEEGDVPSEEESPVEPQKPTGKTTLTISAVGDIMVHLTQLKAARQGDGTYDFYEVFQDVKPYFDKADVVMGNLETTISTDEIGYTAYPRFRTPESILPALKAAGFDVITTANNHSLDGTEFGVKNTLDKLDEYGFLHTGTARSPEEKDEVLIIEKNDIKIGVLAYTYGTNGMEGAVNREKLSYMVNYLEDEERIKEDIKRARQEGAEIVIGCIHWGAEYVRQPNDTQKQLADRLFSYGMDVIFGSHPHVLQPMEKKKVIDSEGNEKDGFVIYSLGNFVSNQRDRYKDSGVILNLEVIKDYDRGTVELGEINYVPTWVYRYTQNEKLHYRILPVIDFLDQDLTENAGQRLKAVWQETTTHLNKDEIRAQE